MAFKVERKKKRNKLPPFRILAREGTRVTFKIDKKIHKKGAIIQYKGEPHIVRKVTKRGIFVSKFKSNGITELEESEKFISEGKIQKGKVYPYIPLIAI